MDSLPELEYRFHHIGEGQYRIDCSFGKQIWNGEKAFPDLSYLLDVEQERYAEELTKVFFDKQSSVVKTAFIEARARAEEGGKPLRISLIIDANDPLINSYRWELLQEPNDKPDPAFLFQGNRFLLSRNIPSSDGWKIEGLDSKQIRILIAIAAPDVTLRGNPYNLTPIDRQKHIKAIEAAFPSNTYDTLPHTTRSALTESLKIGHNIFCLICHGDMIDGQSKLFLETDDGDVDRIDSTKITDLIKNSLTRPDFMVLISCKSSGTSGNRNNGLVALGPRLASIGVGAVLAVQDNISMEDVEIGLPIFFKEFLRTNQLDLALAAMRQVLAMNDGGWWQPVLFLRRRINHEVPTKKPTEAKLGNQRNVQGNEQPGKKEAQSLNRDVRRINERIDSLDDDRREIAGQLTAISNPEDMSQFPFAVKQIAHLDQELIMKTQELTSQRNTLIDEINNTLKPKYQEADDECNRIKEQINRDLRAAMENSDPIKLNIQKEGYIKELAALLHKSLGIRQDLSDKIQTAEEKREQLEKQIAGFNVDYNRRKSEIALSIEPMRQVMELLLRQRKEIIGILREQLERNREIFMRNSSHKDASRKYVGQAQRSVIVARDILGYKKRLEDQPPGLTEEVSSFKEYVIICSRLVYEDTRSLANRAIELNNDYTQGYLARAYANFNLANLEEEELYFDNSSLNKIYNDIYKCINSDDLEAEESTWQDEIISFLIDQLESRSRLTKEQYQMLEFLRSPTIEGITTS